MIDPSGILRGMDFSSSEVMENNAPLAEKMRPRSVESFLGQQHVFESGKPLYEAVKNGNMHSMVFWGPPGCGKTTLARLIANYSNANFISLSAVLSGISDVRKAVASAKEKFLSDKQQTVLFIDEVHRFNKAQQDAFLPYIEDGSFIFVGATTENPSFELNNALLSRVKVYVLNRLDDETIVKLISSALTSEKNEIGELGIKIRDDDLKKLVNAADGDARRALNFLEIMAAQNLSDLSATFVPSELIDNVVMGQLRYFDKKGDQFYDQISALHKAVRGSAPDAALYWLCRMLDGGCDIFYVARRVVRMASEDIGNADPRALQLAMNAWEVLERLGQPEGDLALAQAVVYLSSAPKSNAVYLAYKMANASVKKQRSYSVPLHLRNAPTTLAKNLGHGKKYRYSHDEPNAFSAGVNYFPDEMAEEIYYEPKNFGLESRISERLNEYRRLNKIAKDADLGNSSRD